MTKLRGRLLAKIWIGFLVLLASLSGPVVLGNSAVWAADSCTAPATDYGTDTMSAPIPSTASYTVWTHIKIPSSSANSILLNVAGTCYNVGASTSVPANTWEWIDYYDGSTSKVITQSLTQGSKNVELIGTSTGVLVDQIEFVPGSCVPTGNGSNCTTATTTTGGSSGSGGGGGGTTTSGGGGSTSGSGGGSVSVVQSGGSLTPSTTSTPTQIDSPVTLQPSTSGSASDPVIEVQYYLNKKLLATVTTAPFTYKLDSTKILNGTYTLTTKTTYASGNVTTTSQKLIVKNPASLRQLLLAAEHYIVAEVITLIVLIVGFKLLRKWLRSRQGQVSGDGPMPAVAGGDGYVPLSYAPSAYPTENPSLPPQPPMQPTDGTPPTNGEGNYAALPYANSPGAAAPQEQQVPPANNKQA